MSFADEILRVMESAVARLLEAGIPGASIVGQLAGKVLPPPAADADVPYAATEHTHPLADLEQGGATLGQIVTWDGTAWTADDPAAGSIPLTTQGDLLTRDASANVRLGIGSGGTYLRSDGSDPSWQPIGAADLPLVDLSDNDFLFGALPVVNGGTGASTAIAALNNLMSAGTYTPTYTGATTAGSTTYSVQVGRYYRLGNLCWFSARVDWTAATGTGAAQVSLPLQAKNTSNFAQSLSVYASNVTFGASGLLAAINPGASVALVGSPTSNGATASIAVEAAGLIILTGIYEVN